MSDAFSTDERDVKSLLVVEDDADLSNALCAFLRLHGYEVIPCYSGSEARFHILSAEPREFPFNVVICDRMLPGLSGEELISLVRVQSNVPIIVISARDSVDERVVVLQLGADDYIVKPFSFEELLARVEVQLRRSTKMHISANDGEHGEKQLVYKDWIANEASREFVAAGNPIHLTRTEFDIVTMLMRSPGRVFMRSDFLAAAFRQDISHEERTIDTHIAHIRKKIKEVGAEDYIKTVWSVGFMLGGVNMSSTAAPWWHPYNLKTF